MSRPAKCREISQPDLSSPSARPVLLRDEALLRRLARLCGQPLEDNYKRKLEAIRQLLQRTDRRQVEDRAGTSLRTIQRWARLARRLGPEALRSRSRDCQVSKLSDEQRARLAVDLKRGSTTTKRAGLDWSATSLRQHILDTYGVHFSLRHCRRLLISLGLAKRRAGRPADQRRQHGEIGRAQQREAQLAPIPIGDYEHKRRSLARIKQLASSGLPLQAFAYTLFDLVQDAVPYDQSSPGLTVETNGGASWITRDFDYSRWFPSMQKYVLEPTPQISGFNPPALLPSNPSTVLCHEQMARPDFHRSEGYNEFFACSGSIMDC